MEPFRVQSSLQDVRDADRRHKEKKKKRHKFWAMRTTLLARLYTLAFLWASAFIGVLSAMGFGHINVNEMSRQHSPGQRQMAKRRLQPTSL
ncbi:unnamed protein product [Gulo gulo]|uniref:Uncharacterized protein n=1 Tax=Gulo gulo TaxID=48420 RepID=A0A9X9Q1U3_GULGU|nr:unnamed protein product [Gulo gulo]